MGAKVVRIKPEVVIPDVVPIFRPLYTRIKDMDMGDYFMSAFEHRGDNKYKEVIEMLKAIQEDSDWKALAALPLKEGNVYADRRELFEWELNGSINHGDSWNIKSYELRVSNGEELRREILMNTSQYMLGERRRLELHSVVEDAPLEGEFYFWGFGKNASGIKTIRSQNDDFETLIKELSSRPPRDHAETMNLENLRNKLLDYVRFAPYNDHSSSFSTSGQLVIL